MMGEYVLVFVIVLSVMGAMTVYFKRAIQARMYDARNAMVGTVYERTNEINYVGEIGVAYEPYYTNTTSSVQRTSESETRLKPGLTTGIFSKTINETTAVQTESTTAPPKDVDLF
jgi:hypothetical protein